MILPLDFKWLDLSNNFLGIEGSNGGYIGVIEGVMEERSMAYKYLRYMWHEHLYLIYY